MGWPYPYLLPHGKCSLHCKNEMNTFHGTNRHAGYTERQVVHIVTTDLSAHRRGIVFPFPLVQEIYPRGLKRPVHQAAYIPYIAEVRNE
jgi:hypothetical protein